MAWFTRLRSSITARLPHGGGARLRRSADARWAGQAGAPQFRVDPLANRLPDGHTVRLLMTFAQIAGQDVEASLRARWRGAATDADFATPLIDIAEHSYQMKVVLADPTQTSDAELEPQHVGFEVAFAWKGAERHCLWIWPLVQERDGRWVLNATPANTEQPAQRW